MLLLDVTIVNVALPSIERDLGANFSDLQWVIDAYALTLAGFVHRHRQIHTSTLGPKVGPEQRLRLTPKCDLLEC
jgi:MFS family permease